jgi:hypothetical protein
MLLSISKMVFVFAAKAFSSSYILAGCLALSSAAAAISSFIFYSTLALSSATVNASSFTRLLLS